MSINGAAQPAKAVVTYRAEIAALGQGVTVKNTGTGPFTRMVSVRGLPQKAPAASAAVLSIANTSQGTGYARGYEAIQTLFPSTDSNGKPVDLMHLQQNSRLVVHLTGKADDVAYHQTMLVDPLPAGFEIERVVQPSTDDNANGLPWLGTITPTRTAEKRDDRFMAAIDLSRWSNDDGKAGGRGFNIAYVVRVVSPGTFVLPAASIRDMYRPGVQARGAVGTIAVEAPK